MTRICQAARSDRDWRNAARESWRDHDISDYPGYQLLHSGRYAHSDTYIKEILEQSDFELIRQKTLPLRKERGEWLQGGFYLARYSGG